MFEMPFLSFKTQVIGKYGLKGIEILKEFRNKEILDTINSMSDEELETFYHIIEENLSKTENALNWCIKNGFLPDEERFDYDSFYHNCYVKLARLIEKNDFQESKYEAINYKRIIENIRANIKSASDIKNSFNATYKVKDDRCISFLKEFYPHKEYIQKYIENYFKKLVNECGFEIEVIITDADILMLIQAALSGFIKIDVLSKLSFVNKQENLLNSLRNFEEEFKEILISLTFDRNDRFIPSEDLSEEELEIYLFVIEGLEKTKSVKEEDLLNSAFENESTKESPFLQKRYSDE